MKRKLLLLLSVLALTASAENISVEMAKQIATDFFKNNRPQLSVKNLKMAYDGETPESRANGESPALYVFDNPQGKGFVVVSGDDIAQPILGYSYENDFLTDELPPHVKGWLESLKRQINDGRKYGVISTPSSRSISRAGIPIVKLETALWNQAAPYHNLCPKINGEFTPTGCVITATAIIMKYHEWPKKGIGTIPGYTTETNKINMPAIELGHEYQWDNMPLSYSKNYTTEQAEQVARLMADLGTMLEADYDKRETGASTIYLAKNLITYMNYDKSALYCNRSSYMDTDWHNLMKNELQQGRPIFYSGSNEEAGHAFVLDGYTADDFYSVNWGWGGYCNGYFLLEALIPNGSGMGGNNDHYNFLQDAVIGLQPNVDGEYVKTCNFINQGGLYTNITNFEQNKMFTLEVRNVYNFSNIAINALFQLALVNKNNELKETLDWWVANNLNSYYGWNSTKRDVIITKPIETGDRIRLYFKIDTDDEWILVKGGEDCVWELLVADEFTLAQKTSIEFERNTRILKVKTKNNTTVQWTDENGKDWTNLCKSTGDRITIITIETESLPASNYFLKLTRGNENLSIKIKLGEFQK